MRHRPDASICRAVPAGALLLVALCCVPVRGAHADPAPWITAEDMLVEVRAGRLATRTVLARLVRGEVLLPCREIFDLLEMDVSLTGAGRLEVEGGRGWPRIVVDPAVPEAYAGRRPINPDDLRVEWDGTELYLGTRAAGDLLSTPIQVDLSDLAVTLEDVDHLPIGRRVARERAREAWLARQGIRRPDVILGTEPATLRGAALTWGVSAPIHRAEGTSAGDYRLGFGAGLVGGSLDLEYLSGGWEGERDGQWDGSWMRAWPEEKWVRQTRLGTIAGTGPHARFVRGGAVSNSPYQRMAYFGETSVVGRVPPGWEVEVWQDGHPVGFATADEYGLFDAPVGVEYGTNVVEIRAYGERGEEAWLSRALQIDSERIPVGEFEYQASWGECESGPCNTQGNLDLRYGVREALTVRAGADWFTRDTESALFHPYTELVGAWRQKWLARMEGVAEAFGAVELGYHPTPDLRAGVIHTVYDTDVAEPVLTPRDVESRTRVSVFWRPDEENHSRFLDSSVGRTRSLRWTQTRGRLGYHDRLGRVRWTADWQELRTDGDLLSRQSLLGLTASATLSAAGKWLGRYHGRGFFSVDARTGALDRRGLSLGRNLGRMGRAELSVEWFPDEERPLLSLNMSTEGLGFRSSSHVTRTPSGYTAGRTEAEGALVWNEAAGRVEASPLVTPGRGGISGQAFVDENGNGVMDLHEEPLEGVRVIAADRLVRTDRNGRYSIWDLPAFEAVEVRLDLSGAENPLLTAPFSRAAVPVRPNGYRELNIPMALGVEVSGRILAMDATGATQGLGGVPVILRHVVTAREHRTTTFHDGEFYVVSVPPGDYEVTVPRAYLERAGLRPEHTDRRYLLRASRTESRSIELVLVGEESP